MKKVNGELNTVYQFVRKVIICMEGGRLISGIISKAFFALAKFRSMARIHYVV